LLFLFIVVPLVDLFLLLWISKHTGLAATIALVITTGVIGASLARRQGSFVKGQIKDRLSQRQMPADLLGDGAMIMFAAGLLLTPGLLTDLLGFSLLLPSGRAFYKRIVADRFKSTFQVQQFPMPGQSPGPSQPHHQNDPNIIEGEIVDRGDD
jgi:UPF0716 protein FxsA